MENIIIVVVLILSIFILKVIFKISLREAKELQENKTLEKITDKFPENREIAKEILNTLGNNTVKIEEAKDTKTSLYIAITNKIVIADLKNNYARIQTIAHECAHSIQNKRILISNFIISNISIIYYLSILILSMCNIINNFMLHIALLLLIGLIKLIIRIYLETEAMTKSQYIAEKYIASKELCTLKEQKELLQEYDKINKIGIPFIIDNLVTTQLTWILLYTIIICII